MKFKHIVVVHGIGDQKSNETVIGFMNEFIRSMPDDIRKEVDIHNLLSERMRAAIVAHTHPGEQDGALKRAVGHHLEPAYLTIGKKGCPPDYAIAFSEVYWQPVTNKYLVDNVQPPIPIFTWAHSVNTRLFHGGPDFRRAREAIDNLEKMLDLIKRLAAIYKKSGELATILERFLGDVQMYVESWQLRQEINQEFFNVLDSDEAVAARILGLLKDHHKEAPERIEKCDWASHDIYVIAHSEGTVVSYFSLVQAAAEREDKAGKHKWLDRVSGLVTMGSPLDKHYSIWENRFLLNNLKTTFKKKIEWYNYADVSDPVGKCLDVLVKDAPGMDANRMFDVKFDEAFARYPIPGKAHTDYWMDREIHLDILHKVMGIGEPRTKKVKSKWWGHHWIMSSLDYAAWATGRLATVCVLVFFMGMLCVPIRLKWPEIGAELHWLWPHLRWMALSVVAGMVLLKLIGWVQDRRTDPPSRALEAACGLLYIAMLLVAALRFDIFDKNYPGGMALMEWIGYLGGLVVTGLVWRLHTVVHKGLVQMWRYTTGWKDKSIETTSPEAARLLGRPEEA